MQLRKESQKGHHYVPQFYLKRFSHGKSKTLKFSNKEKPMIFRTVSTNKLLKENGLYDLSGFTEKYENFKTIEDGFLEETLFSHIFEKQMNKALKQYIDRNILPSSEACQSIIHGVWILYLRTQKIKNINKKITNEVSNHIPSYRRDFLDNFGMTTSKIIMKLLPKTFRHTEITFFNSVGIKKFMTSDNPAIPCISDEQLGTITIFDTYTLQKHLLLSDTWPEYVSLLCPLSPRWCILIKNTQNVTQIKYKQIDSSITEQINNLTMTNADSFIIHS